MAQETESELIDRINNDITDNGANAIDGTKLNVILINFAESLVNKLSDATDLATANNRVGTQAITNTNNIQVTFSTPLGTTNYQIFIDDPSGVRTGAFHDLTTTGFQVDGTGNGTISWMVMIDN